MRHLQGLGAEDISIDRAGGLVSAALGRSLCSSCAWVEAEVDFGKSNTRTRESRCYDLDLECPPKFMC